MKNEMNNAAPDEPPFPKRFWWLKRLIVGGILFVGMVWGLRWCATRVAERRLSAEIEKLHARGQTVLVGDFVEPVVRDEENAAAYLQRAGKLLDLDRADANALDKVSLSLPMSATDQRTVRRIVESRSEGLAELRRARKYRQANWGLDMRTPLFNIPLRHLSQQKEMAELVTAAAVMEHERGNDAAAVEYLRDMMVISRAIGRQPCLVSHVVSIGVASVAAARSDALAFRLKVVAGSGSADGNGPAREEQVTALINDFLDDDALAEALANSLSGERMIQVDTAMWIARSVSYSQLTTMALSGVQTPIGPQMWVFKSMVYTEARDMIRLSNRWIDASHQPTLPAANTMIPQWDHNPARAPLASILMPAINRAFVSHYQSIQRRRQSAILLAQALYRARHGRFASRVEDLVPEFLPSVPQDPVRGGDLAMPILSPATQPASGLK
jgi:hypothetical protein